MEILDEYIVNEKNTENSKRKFAVFQKINNLADVEGLLQLFKENDISYRAKEKKAILDPIIIGQTLEMKYWIEIYDSEFVRANKILEQLAADNFSTEDITGHYLNDLTNEELEEMIIKPDEWNQDAIMIAKLILDSRGIQINKNEIEEKIKDRYQALKEPKKASSIAMFIYFIVAILAGYFSILIGSIASIGMGFYYSFFRGTAPDGEKYFEFDESTRQSGFILILVSIIMFIIGLVLNSLNKSIF